MAENTTQVSFAYESGMLTATYSPPTTKGTEHASDATTGIHSLLADVNQTLIARGHSATLHIHESLPDNYRRTITSSLSPFIDQGQPQHQ